jgi:hypothetical protein
MFRDLRELHQNVEQLLQPLQMLTTLFSHEPTGRLASLLHLADGTNVGGGGWAAMAAAMGWQQQEPSLKSTDHNVEMLCAVWIDSLVWHCSKQQGTWGGGGVPTSDAAAPSRRPPSSSADVAPLLHMILLTTAWPYVETLVWVIVGAVPNIDEEEWLRRCPNIFAAPFPQPRDSHAAAGLMDFDDFNDDNLDGGAARRRKMREDEANFVYAASAISIAAGCEGITRHDSWRSVHIHFQNAVKHVLVAVERSLTASVIQPAGVVQSRSSTQRRDVGIEGTPPTDAVGLSTLRPLTFCVSTPTNPIRSETHASAAASSPTTQEELLNKNFAVRCNFDPLGVGITCSLETFFVTKNVASNSSSVAGDADVSDRSCLYLDTSVPVSQWAINAILHPLAKEASKRQREAVSELLTKKVKVIAASATAAAAPTISTNNLHAVSRPRRNLRSRRHDNNAGVTLSFVNSVDLICQHALFCGDGGAAFGQAFVDGVAALPSGWWASPETVPLLASAYFAAQLIAPSQRGAAAAAACRSGGGDNHMFVSLTLPPQDPDAPMTPSHIGGLLRVIQSCRLTFTLPETHAVILLPHLYYPSQQQQHHEAGVPHSHDADCYSKLMRLMTVLLLAKDLLLRRWKELRWGGAAASSSGSSRRDTTDSGGNTSVLVAVGAMHLSFVINAVVEFLTSEVRLAVATLKAAVQRERSNVANICRATDEFIAHLELVSLQQHPSLGSGGERMPLAGIGSQLVFEGIASVLRLALDFAWFGIGQQSTGFVPSLVAPRVKSAASQLIAALRAVPLASPLYERVQPLLLRLTFNGYFGAQ